MLHTARPDVVHITSAAESHFRIGMMCLEAGCHIFVEKPFTLTAQGAEDLIRFAESRGLKVTAGYNLQFTSEAVRMRELVKRGFLGGAPIYIECVQCFGEDDPIYGKVLHGDSSEWLKLIPGSLLPNLISHGLAKIAEFLPSDQPKVIAHADCSPFLRAIGQNDLVDELRAIIYDSENTTAHFTFSAQLGGAGSQFRVHGPKASLVADRFDRNSWWDIRNYMKNDHSMRLLIQLFYRAIVNGSPLPIPYREILVTARMMDIIFSQIYRVHDAQSNDAGSSRGFFSENPSGSAIRQRGEI